MIGTAESSSTARPLRPRPFSLQQLGAAAGGILGGLGAMSCCVLPFLLFTIGAGGPWVGALAGLAPYQPYFVGFGLVSLSAGFALAYRRNSTGCLNGACARPLSDRVAKVGLWAASALILLSLAWPYLAPLVLPA